MLGANTQPRLPRKRRNPKRAPYKVPVFDKSGTLVSGGPGHFKTTSQTEQSGDLKPGFKRSHSPVKLPQPVRRPPLAHVQGYQGPVRRPPQGYPGPVYLQKCVNRNMVPRSVLILCHIHLHSSHQLY